MLEEKKNEKNFINSISIQNFRNHEALEISVEKPSIVIYGKNGVGKTSILEALSIFSNGKGLRNSKLIEMTKLDKDMFCISLNVQIENNIPLELKSTYNKSQKTRKIYINGKEEKSFNKIKKNFPMIWVTPYDEKIFRGGASLRRNFLDRLVGNFDIFHNSRIIEYNKLLKQRSKLLKDKINDFKWLDVIEDQLAKLAVTVCASRLDIVFRLSKLLEIKSKGLPKVSLKFSDSIENQLMESPALEIEDELKKKYLESRKLDFLIGGSLYGCQKTDFICHNLDKNMPAEMCSSGEQKLLLISIILASSKALKQSTKVAPIMLLDEIFTHLDSIIKSYLFNELRSLGSQIWITTAETDNFLNKYDNVYYYELKKRIEI